MPEEGINASDQAGEVSHKLGAFDVAEPRHPFLGAPTLTVSAIAGGAAINMGPDEATLGIDIRPLPAQQENGMRQQLVALLGQDVTIQKSNGARGMSADPERPWAQQVYDLM